MDGQEEERHMTTDATNGRIHNEYTNSSTMDRLPPLHHSLARELETNSSALHQATTENGAHTDRAIQHEREREREREKERERERERDREREE